MAEKIQIFKDEAWTKTKYAGQPIWDEVWKRIIEGVQRCQGHPDMVPSEEAQEYGLVSEEQELVIQRQVALALYDNITSKFQGDSQMLKEYTRNQQSHWNFMLLGQARARVFEGKKRTVFFGRQEQPVTHYFLVKCLMRLRLQGVEFDWDSFLKTLEKGDRWRVMASPMRKPQRDAWVSKYGEVRPSLEYPAPWKIAEEFRTDPMPLQEPQSQRMWVEIKKGQEVEQVFTDYEYDHVVRACTVQNDGIFFISKNEAELDTGLFQVSARPWLLQGLDQPDGLQELDDPSINRERFKDILRAALKQALEAEQRAKDLEKKVDYLKETLQMVTDDFLLEVERREKLQQRLDDIRRLTQWADRDKAELKEDGLNWAKKD